MLQCCVSNKRQLKRMCSAVSVTGASILLWQGRHPTHGCSPSSSSSENAGSSIAATGCCWGPATSQTPPPARQRRHPACPRQIWRWHGSPLPRRGRSCATSCLPLDLICVRPMCGPGVCEPPRAHKLRYLVPEEARDLSTVCSPKTSGIADAGMLRGLD